jgi:hypothetical protein
MRDFREAGGGGGGGVDGGGVGGSVDGDDDFDGEFGVAAFWKFASGSSDDGGGNGAPLKHLGC